MKKHSLNIYNLDNHKWNFRHINDLGFFPNSNYYYDDKKKYKLLSNNNIKKDNLYFSCYQFSKKIEPSPLTREWYSGHYLYRRSQSITLLFYEKLIRNFIEHYFKGKSRWALLSLGSFKHTNKTIQINIFYYKIARLNKWNVINQNKSSTNKEKDPQNFHFLSQQSLNKLSLIFSKILNKNVELKLTRLFSPYLNADIFSQYLAILVKSNSFYKIKSILAKKINFIKYENSSSNNNNNNININTNLEKLLNVVFFKPHLSLSSSSWLTRNLISRRDIDQNQDQDNDLITKILIRHIWMNRNKSNKIIEFFDQFKDQKLQNFTEYSKRSLTKFRWILYLKLLSYKYISGLSITLKGRMTRRKTATRSRYYTYSNGSFTNYSHHLNLLRNQYNCNIDKSKSTWTNKNGAFTIKVSLALR